MKRIYSTFRPPTEQKSYSDWITRRDQKLALSTRGHIAFTSSYCLNQSRPTSSSHHLYVVDINTPYQPFLLIDSQFEFTTLEWDPSGTKLLVCDARGCVTIYTSKEYLISDWKPYFKQAFVGEQFITACWYHSGIVSTINVPNQNLKNSSNHLEYGDKIQQNKFGASLRLFGGKAAEGCILISRTGLVCSMTLMADSTVDVTSDCLGPARMKIELADISYCKDGTFVVGTSAGLINSTISFYRIRLSLKGITLDDVDTYSGNEGKRVTVVCEQFNSFHLNVMSQILNERENTTCAFERVNHIKFVSKGSPNDVLIEISGQNLSLIELWELETKSTSTIHSAILELKNNPSQSISNSTTSGSKSDENGSHMGQQLQQQLQSGKTHNWCFKGNFINDKDLAVIQVPRFKIFGHNRQLNIILLAYRDSTVCCLRKEDLQPIDDTLDLSDLDFRGRVAANGTHRNDSTGTKSIYKMYPNRGNVKPCLKLSNANNRRPAKPNYITDIQFSPNQTIFVAVDSLSQLHVVRLPPLIACQDGKDEETYLQYILEYCLITGNDWWDAMVCASRDSIETICDKFHDAYERQPKHMQRAYFNRQLMIRASLYRCLNEASSLCKSSDCHTMIMLNSIASTIKSMLRSSDQESPAECLSNFLKSHLGTQSAFFSCNNVLSKINEKEFYVETNLTQCLQPINQWITELAIFLVASLPQRIRSGLQLPGAGLCQNKEALETLRELLIIIKIWGTQNEACLPIVYKLNDQTDALGDLFKLISICYSTLGNEGPPEDSFLDECIQFANNISVSQFSFYLAPIGVASPLLTNRLNEDTHLVLEYFQVPILPELVSLDKVEGSINLNGNRKIDVVRNVSLGAHPVLNVRHCTRCKSVSHIKPSFNSDRIWEQRWMTTCVCGGSWAQSDVFASKLSHLAMLQHHTNTMGGFTQLANQLAR